MIETWFYVSLAAAFLIALTDIGDKILLGRYVKSPMAFTVFSGLVQGILGIALLCGAAATLNAPTYVIALAAFCGILSALSHYCFYASVKIGEIGGLIAILYTFPLFTLVLATIFLGERITQTQTLGVLLIVVGAGAVSIEKISKTRKSVHLKAGVTLMLGSAVLSAVIGVIEKHSLAFVTPQAFMGIATVVYGTLVVAALANRKTREKFKEIIRRPKLTATIAANDAIAFASYLLYAVVLSTALVSLAAPISAIRPLIVFVLVLLVTAIAPKYLKEKLDAKTALVKLVGAALVVAGAALIVS